MYRQAVHSSNIASIGYDSSRRVLEVEFRSGAVYQYFGVPETIYRGLVTHVSPGSYLNEMVKQAGYNYSEVR